MKTTGTALDLTVDASLDETVSSLAEEYTLSDKTPSDFSLTHTKLSTATERYQVKSLLGHGGMSFVHKVLDTRIGREVALKRIDPDKKSARLGFFIEGRVMSQLDHPGILPVYDFVEERNEKGIKELVGYTMRIASHSSLYEALILRGMIEIHELCHILRQVALALEHAHNRGVLHRDIKPHNILLGKEGEVYLIDWGVCSLLTSHPDYHLLKTFRKDALIGTPNYMAPEQTLRDDSLLSISTDLYGLGATLYYCLTNRSPFTGSDLPELLRLVAAGEVTPPHQIWEARGEASPFPESIEAICLKALSKNPADRFQSAREFAEALERCSSGQLELERARSAAQESFEIGQKSARSFKEVFEKRASLTDEIDQLNQSHKRQRSEDTRRSLWEAEEELDKLVVSQEASFSKAISSLQTALRYDSDHEASRAALFELYMCRYEYAMTSRDSALQIFFEERLRLYANKSELESFNRPSELIFTGLPLKTRVKIFDHPVRRRQLTLTLHSTIDDYQGEVIYLPRGNFLVELVNPRGATVRVPLQLGTFQQVTLNTPIPKQEAIPAGFQYIEQSWAISTYPVTAEEYYSFLNALSSEEGDERRPRYHQTAYAERAESGLFELPYQDIEGDQWQPDWPILLINHFDAVAYCHWLSQKREKTYRLPSAEEWLFAASGGDGRSYPWGDTFDPSLSIMRESHQQRPSPTAVGTAIADRSPFGVRDVAGIICQWTSSSVEGMKDHYRVMGAAYNSFEVLCRLDQELVGHQDETFTHVGFRPLLELSKDDFLSANES